MIRYIYSTDSITPSQLAGFFVGWPNPPGPDTHLRLLSNSDEVVLAVDEESGQVAGFISALTDRVLAAYIPFLEVLPAYQKRGVGKELVSRMLERLKNLYMIDLLCDENLQAFYERLGMRRALGMFIRNYDRQAGC